MNTMLQVDRELIDKYPFATGKRKLEHRNAKLHCMRLVLEDRLEHFDAIAMILREYNINVMVQQLALLEQLITAVEKRKAECSGRAMIYALPEQTMACGDNYDDLEITREGTVVIIAGGMAA